MFQPILIAIAGLIPAFFFILRLRHAQTRRLASVSSPFGDEFPRPPGEHLRLRIGELQARYERALESLLVPCIIVTTVAIIGSILVTETLPLSSHLSIGALVLTAASYVCYHRGPTLRRLMIDLENYRLGLEGEHRVGVMLGALEHDGCAVFHDLPIEPANGAPFHVDHVVVGPAGIFAIQTVTRLKEGTRGNRSEITHRGDYLEFSDGEWSREHVEAARNRGWAFEAWLSTHIHNPGVVRPILTFPGWSVVETERSSDVTVLNPKQIRSHILALRRRGGFLALEPAAPEIDPTRLAALRSLLKFHGAAGAAWRMEPGE